MMTTRHCTQALLLHIFLICMESLRDGKLILTLHIAHDNDDAPEYDYASLSPGPPEPLLQWRRSPTFISLISRQSWVMSLANSLGPRQLSNWATLSKSFQWLGHFPNFLSQFRLFKVLNNALLLILMLISSNIQFVLNAGSIMHLQVWRTLHCLTVSLQAVREISSPSMERITS